MTCKLVATVHDIDQYKSNALEGKRSWVQCSLFVCAALKVSMHHLFLQPSVAGAQPAPPLFVFPLWSLIIF